MNDGLDHTALVDEILGRQAVQHLGHFGGIHGQLVAQRRAELRRVTVALELFVAGKEEQLVLQDRPAQGEALGGVLEVGRRKVSAGVAVEAIDRKSVV